MKRKLIILLMILSLLPVIQPSQKANANEKDSEPINTVTMDEPPFKYYISDNVESTESADISPLKLKKVLAKANNIVDDERWFKKNRLSMNTYKVPNLVIDVLGNVPDGIDLTWNGLIITQAFYDSTYTYCTYGANYAESYILNIYDSKTLELLYSMDFSNYIYSPKYVKADINYIDQQVVWATIKDNILYVSHAHASYAYSSNNMNAYITAIDLSDMSILWRTKGLVCNSYNFLVIDNVIICGYGFTDEKDYLYQINMNNGKVLSKVLMKSAISYIIKKGNSLYIRTYNTDYKFTISN